MPKDILVGGFVDCIINACIKAIMQYFKITVNQTYTWRAVESLSPKKVPEL